MARPLPELIGSSSSSFLEPPDLPAQACKPASPLEQVLIRSKSGSAAFPSAEMCLASSRPHRSSSFALGYRGLGRHQLSVYDPGYTNICLA